MRDTWARYMEESRFLACSPFEQYLSLDAWTPIHSRFDMDAGASAGVHPVKFNYEALCRFNFDDIILQSCRPYRYLALLTPVVSIKPMRRQSHESLLGAMLVRRERDGKQGWP
jgi:hypothetical protein